MPTVANPNDQAITQGFSNLAKIFAPPTGQELYMAGTLQQAAAKAALARSQTQQVADIYGPGAGALVGLDPAGGVKNWVTAEAARQAQGGANPAALDGLVYARDGNAGNTFTGQQNKPLSANEVRVLTPGSAAALRVPQTQYGAQQTASDAITTLPGAGGILQPADPVAAAAMASKGDDEDAAAPASTMPAPRGGMTISNPSTPDPMTSDQLTATIMGRASAADQLAWAKAHGTGQTFNIGGEKLDPASKAAEEGYGGGVGDVLKKVVSDGAAAPDIMRNTATMRAAIQSAGPNLTYGPGSDAALKLKQAWASITGDPNVPGMAEGQVINNIGYGLAGEAARAINPRGGTQAEFLQALQTKPGLAGSKPGALALLDIYDQNAKAKQDLAALAAVPANRTNWQATEKNYYATHPIMSPFDPSRPIGRQDADLIAQGQIPGAAAPAPPAAVGPKVGDVQDGYVFKGGNAADPNAWAKQ
jgi:hypothetical protein